LTGAVVIGFALAGENPYLQMGACLYGAGVLGIVLLQFIGSISVVGFFQRNPHSESRWATLAAPGLAAVGLACGLVLMIHNYALLTGSKTFLINHLPWLLLVAAALGAVVAHSVRGSDSRQSSRLDDGVSVDDPATPGSVLAG
jgi:hypothetical protein